MRIPPSLPGIEGVSVPFLARDKITRNMSASAGFDAGRGLPVSMQLFAIIDVQGGNHAIEGRTTSKRSCARTAPRGSRTLSYRRRLRAKPGLGADFRPADRAARGTGHPDQADHQVDALSRRIIPTSSRKPVTPAQAVFIGLENINPDNLIAAEEATRITGSRTMLPASRAVRAITYCGYIIGFPERYARTGNAGHRGRQARAAGRFPRVFA